MLPESCRGVILKGRAGTDGEEELEGRQSSAECPYHLIICQAKWGAQNFVVFLI